MAINIKLPKGGVRAGVGTKIFTESGEEITDVSLITIRIAPNEIVSATIEVPIGSETNLDGLAVQLGYESAGSLVAEYSRRKEGKE